MKKFAICCLVLVASAMMVPSAQAGTFCIHFTNFCDGFQVTSSFVGGFEGTEWVGKWDWLCVFNGQGTLMSGGPNKIGTQPAYPYYPSFGTVNGFAANFKFGVVNFQKTFDLYGTFDGMNTFAFQTAQPWTKTAGPCSPLHAQQNLPKSTVQQ
jgi:hypothetical protein